jgi:alpha-beta hydrolase superfamily lysophospholipase
MPALIPPPATVRTWDGLDLVLRHWPAPQAMRGRIHLVHGLGEHLGRYEHVAAHLNARGWDVTGHDQRGHGASPGVRGALRAGDDLIEDLARVLDAVRPSEGPFVLLGHSMGGLVAAQFVAADRGPVDALVLTSPALDAALGPLQRIQLAFGLAFVPDLAMGNQLDATKISHDPDVVRKYLADPLVHDRITARLAKALLDGGAYVRARAAAWSVPTLLLWAGSDRLVSPSGSAAFAAAAPRAVLTSRCFDDLYHEILNERDAAPVYAALDEWLDPRRGAISEL